MKRCKIVKKRKGAALVLVLIMITILMIFMTSIVFITRQDILETRMQEERLQTYYIALSGIDLTYAALMDPSKKPLLIDNIISTLKVNNKPIKDIIPIEISGSEKGKAYITIDRVEEKDSHWIRIVSIGELKNKNTTVKTTMKINEDNKNQIIREKFDN